MTNFADLPLPPVKPAEARRRRRDARFPNPRTPASINILPPTTRYTAPPAAYPSPGWRPPHPAIPMSASMQLPAVQPSSKSIYKDADVALRIGHIVDQIVSYLPDPLPARAITTTFADSVSRLAFHSITISKARQFVEEPSDLNDMYKKRIRQITGCRFFAPGPAADGEFYPEELHLFEDFPRLENLQGELLLQEVSDEAMWLVPFAVWDLRVSYDRQYTLNAGGARQVEHTTYVAHLTPEDVLRLAVDVQGVYDALVRFCILGNTSFEIEIELDYPSCQALRMSEQQWPDGFAHHFTRMVHTEDRTLQLLPPRPSAEHSLHVRTLLEDLRLVSDPLGLQPPKLLNLRQVTDLIAKHNLGTHLRQLQICVDPASITGLNLHLLGIQLGPTLEQLSVLPSRYTTAQHIADGKVAAYGIANLLSWLHELRTEAFEDTDITLGGSCGHLWAEMDGNLLPKRLGALTIHESPDSDIEMLKQWGFHTDADGQAWACGLFTIPVIVTALSSIIDGRGALKPALPVQIPPFTAAPRPPLRQTFSTIDYALSPTWHDREPGRLPAAAYAECECRAQVACEIRESCSALCILGDGWQGGTEMLALLQPPVRPTARLKAMSQVFTHNQYLALTEGRRQRTVVG